ncbi:hypothetical protein EMCRGX_G000491 [Ephydatia muelleri]
MYRLLELQPQDLRAPPLTSFPKTSGHLPSLHPQDQRAPPLTSSPRPVGTSPHFIPKTSGHLPHFNPKTSGHLPSLHPKTSGHLPSLHPQDQWTPPLTSSPRPVGTSPHFIPRPVGTSPQFNPKTSGHLPSLHSKTSGHLPSIQPQDEWAPPLTSSPRPVGTSPHFIPKTSGHLPSLHPQDQWTPPLTSTPRPVGTSPHFIPRPVGTSPQFNPKTSGHLPSLHPKTSGHLPSIQPQDEWAPPLTSSPRPVGTSPHFIPKTSGHLPSLHPKTSGHLPSIQPQDEWAPPLTSSPRPEINKWLALPSKSIPEKFHPPVTLILPKRMFGSKKVESAFRANWCQQFPWLHYNIDRDAAFCHVCMQADNESKFSSSSKMESSFITDGFTNWKEAACSFRSHQQSKSHLEAAEAIITTPKQSADIGLNISGQCLHQKMEKSGSKQNMEIPGDGINALSSMLNPTEHLKSQPHHETEELKFFCKTCQLLKCRNCTLDLHKDHRIADMCSIAKVNRDAMREELVCAQEVTSKLTRAIDANDKMAEQVETSRENATLIITQAFEQLHQTIEERKKTLLSEMEAIALSKTTALSLHKEYRQVKGIYCVNVESMTSKGERCPFGGLQVKAELRPKSNDGAVVTVEVEDHGDGTYTITLTPQTAGPHQLLITMDGQHVQNSPCDLDVRMHRQYNTLCDPEQVIHRHQGPGSGIAIHDIFY